MCSLGATPKSVQAETCSKLVSVVSTAAAPLAPPSPWVQTNVNVIPSAITIIQIESGLYGIALPLRRPEKPYEGCAHKLGRLIAVKGD